MKFTTTTLIIWALPVMAVNATNEEIPSIAADDTLTIATAEPLTVLWDECNMKPDTYGVLSCYRMLSDLSEQDYFYKDGREYSYHPLVRD